MQFWERSEISNFSQMCRDAEAGFQFTSILVKQTEIIVDPVLIWVPATIRSYQSMVLWDHTSCNFKVVYYNKYRITAEYGRKTEVLSQIVQSVWVRFMVKPFQRVLNCRIKLIFGNYRIISTDSSSLSIPCIVRILSHRHYRKSVQYSRFFLLCR